MNKRLRTTLFLLLGAVLPMSADTLDGVYAWVDGSATCYQLSSMPTVTYSTDGSGNPVANLTLKGESTPAVSVTLADGANLEITYGTYVYAKTNAYGFGTFSFSESIQFPAEVNVYTAAVNGEVVQLYEAEHAVPAYNGVIIYGEPSTIFPVSIVTSADAIGANDLMPTTTESGLAPVEGVPYVLSGNKFVMYKASTFPAGKAYLPASAVAARVQSLSFGDADEETGINTTFATTPVTRNGKFISGGRLIIVNDGKRYDANGVQIK